jgi:hypothetical protein
MTETKLITETEGKNITKAGFFANIENLIADNWYPLTLGLFSFPFWCLMVAIFGFIVFIPITKYHAIAAFLLSIASTAWACEWKWKKSLIHGLLVFFLIICVGIAGSFTIASISDDPGYHKPAVIEMKNGWNPIWNYNENNTLKDSKEASGFIWSIYYAKSDWVINAVFYAFSGNLGLGSLTRFLYIIVVIAIVFISIKQLFNLSNIFCTVFSIVAALNPVTMAWNQFMGHLDGALADCLTIVFFSLSAYIKSRDKRLLPFILIGIVIGTNLKFTGVVYIAIFLIISLIPWYLTDWWKKKQLDLTLPKYLTIATILSLIVGINPYIYNIIYHYHPFYPLAVVKKNETFKLNMEKDYFESVGHRIIKANRLQKFAFAYLIPQIRMRKLSDQNSDISPYSIIPEEIFSLRKISHVGFESNSWFIIPMWFSIFALPFIREKNIIIFLIAVWLSVLVNGACWHARDVPQVWFIPLIVLCSLLSQTSSLPQLKWRIKLVTGIMLMCMLLVSTNNLYNTFRACKSHVRVFAKTSYFYNTETPHRIVLPLSESVRRYWIYTWKTSLIPECFPDVEIISERDKEKHYAYIGSTGWPVSPIYIECNNEETAKKIKKTRLTKWKLISEILELRFRQFKQVWINSDHRGTS